MRWEGAQEAAKITEAAVEVAQASRTTGSSVLERLRAAKEEKAKQKADREVSPPSNPRCVVGFSDELELVAQVQ